MAAIGLLLAYEHYLVRPDDLSRVNQAFFHVNAVVSLGLLAVGVVDLSLVGCVKRTVNRAVTRCCVFFAPYETMRPAGREEGEMCVVKLGQ